MRNKLPPLNALRMFEVTARLLSVRQAAIALHVTPAAVSKQIQTLETYLDVKLFVRTSRSIQLTPVGEKYYAHITTALNSIRHATHEVSQGQRKVALKIRAYTTFSMYWLIPQLSSFHKLHPEINVEISTSLKWIDFDSEDVDAAIRLGDGNWPGLVAIPLMPNILAPVCSPSLAKTLRTPDDLHTTTLLHTLARPDDWHHWLSSQGVEDMSKLNHRNYESSVLVYQAATQGQGVGIAQKVLVEPLVESGVLVYPFPHEADMKSYTYYFVIPENRPIPADLKTFQDWLVSCGTDATERTIAANETAAIERCSSLRQSNPEVRTGAGAIKRSTLS